MAGLQVELGYVELKAEPDLPEPLVEHGFVPGPWTGLVFETGAWTESEAAPSTEDEFEHGPWSENGLEAGALNEYGPGALTEHLFDSGYGLVALGRGA